MRPREGAWPLIWRLLSTLALLQVAGWGLPILGSMWVAMSQYHGEPKAEKFAGLGLLIVLTVVCAGLWIVVVIVVWSDYLVPLTPIRKEQAAFAQACRNIDAAYREAVRKVAEEAARRGL